MTSEKTVTAATPRGLLLVMMEVPPEHEDELNRWYDEEHLPERVACPGFLSARRFTALEGSPKHLALYELESPDVLNSEAYRRLTEPTPWTNRIRRLRTQMVRNVYQETPPARTGSLG